MTDPDGTEWLTVALAAERYDIRPSLLYGWVKRGVVQAFTGNAVMWVLAQDVSEAEYLWRTRRRGHRRRANAAVLASGSVGE
jgi:hypothetical protein